MSLGAPTPMPTAVKQQTDRAEPSALCRETEPARGPNGRPEQHPPLRVAFVLHAMQVAGAEVLVAETVRRLAGRIAPTVFCLDAVGPLGERLRAEGVEVVCLGRRPGRDWRVAWRLANELRARAVEVVHAHQYTPFFYAALARLTMWRAPRVVLTEHGRHYPDVVSRLRRTANAWVLDRLADAVNAVCAFSAESLHRVDGFSSKRIEVIENGIDLPRYEPAADRAEFRRRLGLRPDRRHVVCVARFHPVKDHAMLLRAFAAVAAARADVNLLLVGDGPLRGDLERQAAALGVADRVRFLGVRSDVPDLLRAADVFALTSVSEAASLTLLEAMASRLPVVVTAVGGNPEIVRDGREGLLVPRGDAAAAAAALLRLLDDPAAAAAMGEAGRTRVEERYQLDRTIEAYFHLYQRLCRRAS
jgi:glycosyltransferase involved in cell wall biosynthesis